MWEGISQEERIIPAHAGQTCPAHCRSAARPDHPRACGANALPTFDRFDRYGSSPRMRGKRGGAPIGAGCRRIIPAHAGQTVRYAVHTRKPPDHPRACGANWVKWVVGVLVFGSSPRMRGKRLLQGVLVVIGRIIPAHAGQTTRPNGRGSHAPDHPRACGANLLLRKGAEFSPGSSPRMRGKPAVHPLAQGASRIIPAHAGQTTHEATAITLWPDHPRACGANRAGRESHPPPPGSSPRMRGKLSRSVAWRIRGRIIPAHAGQTHSEFFHGLADADHPRACGANYPSELVSTVTNGSSPRMRGKHSC